MKLARNLINQDMAAAVFEILINKIIKIDRIVLLDEDCEEKDILWQKYVTN